MTIRQWMFVVAYLFIGSLISYSLMQCTVPLARGQVHGHFGCKESGTEDEPCTVSETHIVDGIRVTENRKGIRVRIVYSCECGHSTYSNWSSCGKI